MRARVLGSIIALSAACRGDAPKPTSTAAPTHAPVPSVATATVASSSAASSPSTAPEGPWEATTITWDYAESAVGATSVVVVSPKTDRRLPVLVALHGLGEAEKGPKRGARGWVDDYGLLQALARLEAPPLTRADMLQLGTPEHLAALNAKLAAQRFRGMVIVCPYTPNILTGTPALDAARPLARFLVDEVLPRVVRELPAEASPGATGIDGVSLGGRAALLVGLEVPERFGVVATMQPAIYGNELEELAKRVAAARGEQPRLVLRLLTSSADFYLEATRNLSRRLTARKLAHHYTVVDRGPHSYAFNRGLGVYEMLVFHDRALRGEDPGPD
jgi:enterochelin esterase-like enzyme